MKCYFFSVCFTINGFRNCSDSRENGTIPENSIFYRGKCLMDESDLEDILGNYTYYYACEYKDDKTGNMTDGLYYNETNCGADELFPGHPDPSKYTVVQYTLQFPKSKHYFFRHRQSL